jgi:hypothetical protein
MSYDITSASMDALQECPRRYVVDISNLWDEDERTVVQVQAYALPVLLEAAR